MLQKDSDNDALVVTLGSHNYEVDRDWGHLAHHKVGDVISDIAVLEDERIAVLLRGHPAIRCFSPEGEPLSCSFEIELKDPHGITADGDGLLIVDRDNNRIQLFDPDGQLSEIWDGFRYPMGIATLPDGTIVVTDQSPALHAISTEGERIGRARPANDWPHGLSVSSDGCIFMAEMHPTSITRMKPLGEHRIDSE